MGSLPIKATSSVAHANDLLVVTCASGKQATALLPNLAKSWKRLRLVCHSPSSEVKLRKEYPRAEVIRTDLGLPQESERILKDATAIYHVEPPFAHRQAVMGFNMIDAAKKSAKQGIFKHFVYASVLNPMLRKVNFRRIPQFFQFCRFNLVLKIYYVDISLVSIDDPPRPKAPS